MLMEVRICPHVFKALIMQVNLLAGAHAGVHCIIDLGLSISLLAHIYVGLEYSNNITKSNAR